MKNITKTFNYLLIAILSLAIGIGMLLFISSAGAGSIPYSSNDNPGLILKYGAWPDSNADDKAGETNAFTFEIESKDCLKYKFCYNASFVSISNDDGKNAALGLAVKYNMLKRASDRIYIVAGAAGFDRPLNGSEGEQLNLHLGAGIEIHKFILSFDSYGLGERVPTYLVNFGLHF